MFVGSSPGYHAGEHKDKWGHMKARKAIRQHGSSWTSSVPIIAQCSSIGRIGLYSLINNDSDILIDYSNVMFLYGYVST